MSSRLFYARGIEVSGGACVALFTNYRQLYEEERAKVAKLELELKQINDAVREDTLRALADSNQKLREAAATIATMQRVGIRDRGKGS